MASDLRERAQQAAFVLAAMALMKAAHALPVVLDEGHYVFTGANPPDAAVWSRSGFGGVLERAELKFAARPSSHGYRNRGRSRFA